MDAYQVVTRVITDIITERGDDPGELTPDRPLYAFDETVTDALDLDSVDALDLIAAVEAELDIEITDDVDFDGMRTIGDLAAMVHRRARAATMSDPAELAAHRTVAAIERLAEQGLHTSAQVFIRGGGRTRAFTVGVTARGHEPGADTRYMWSCASKPLVAAAIARQVDAGVVDLDAPVTTYVDGLDPAAFAPVTLRALLTHQVLLEDVDEPAPVLPTADVLRLLGRRTPIVEEGRARYSVWANWFLLGQVLEAVCGEAVDTHVERTVAAPLGLDSVRLSLRAGEASADAAPL